MNDVVLRETVTPADAAVVREIVASSGFFHAHEIEVAVELVRERLARGDASGYYFLFAEVGGRTAGYTCYGPIACAVGSFDLYWIAVHAAHRRRGLGRLLLEATEERVRRAAGRRIYIETSGRAQYAPTQAFYRAAGYVPAARLSDFYACGDDKIIYCKALDTPRREG